MATAKSKYKLKQEKGVLHIGGGRFFHPGESYELSADELETYGDYFEKQKAAKEPEGMNGEQENAAAPPDEKK